MLISELILLIASIYYYTKTKHKEAITLIIFSALLLIMGIFNLVIYPLWLATADFNAEKIQYVIIAQSVVSTIFFIGFAIGFVLLINKIVKLSADKNEF